MARPLAWRLKTLSGRNKTDEHGVRSTYALLTRGKKNPERVTLGFVRDDDLERLKASLDDWPDEQVTKVLRLVEAGEWPFKIETWGVNSDVPSNGRNTDRPNRDEVTEDDRRAAVVRILTSDVGDIGIPDPSARPEDMTLREYHDEVYWPDREKEVVSAGAEAGHWRAILNRLGDVPIKEVDAWAVADYLDGMTVSRGKRAGEPASGNTKRLHRSGVLALLKYAYRRKHLKNLPDLSVFVIKGSTKTVQEESDPLTLEEVARLLDAAPAPVTRCLFAVGAGEGLRPSELVRVRWVDVDFQRRLLSVRGSKTDAATDTIPLTPLAYSELKRWHRIEGEPTEGIVFRAPTSRWGTLGTEPYSGGGGYRDVLDRTAKAAGITRHVTPKLLRKSFATIAWSLDVPMDVARRILRHTDETMLRQVYCRPRPSDLVAKVAAFNISGGAA